MPHPVRRALRRTTWIGSAVLLVALAGCGSSSPSSTTNSSKASVRIDTAYFPKEKATVLVNGSGYALYMFLPDHQGSVTCNPTCAMAWPPLTISPEAHVQTGSGIEKNLVGSVAFSSDVRVVTYNRWPLYTYTGDGSPGESNGQATDLNGGWWYLMSPNGVPLVPPGDPSA
jgi:predicted lipoprotein with Yx(FWY)xxD motif